MNPSRLATKLSTTLILISACSTLFYATPSFAQCIPFGELKHASNAIVQRNGIQYQGTAPAALCTGDIVITRESGEAHILMSDGGWLGIGAASQATLNSMSARDREDDNFVVTLAKGSIRAITGWITKMGNENAGQIITPSATIGVRGTDFEIYEDGSQTHAQVNEGTVSASNLQGQKTVIGAGKFGVISSKLAALTQTLPAHIVARKEHAFVNSSFFEQHRQHFAERMNSALEHAGVTPARRSEFIRAAKEHRQDLFQKLRQRPALNGTSSSTQSTPEAQPSKFLGRLKERITDEKTHLSDRPTEK